MSGSLTSPLDGVYGFDPFGAPRLGDFLRLPPAPPRAPPAPPQPGILGGGLRAGFNELQGLGGTAVEAAGSLLGLPGVQSWGRATADQNFREAQQYGRPDLETPPWREGGAPVLPWLGYQAAKQVPMVGGLLLGSALFPEAAVPAGLARLGATVPRALGGPAMAEALGTAGEPAALAAGRKYASEALGATAAGYPLAVGSQYREAVEREEAGGAPASREEAGRAAVLGVPYAAMDAIEPAQLRKFVEAGTKGGARGLLSQGLRAALTGGATEMVTEAAQTALEQSFRPDLTLAQKSQNIVDAALVGGAVGGLFGGVAGGIGGLRRVREADPNALPDADLRQAVDQGLLPQTRLSSFGEPRFETTGAPPQPATQGELPLTLPPQANGERMAVPGRPEPGAMLARHGGLADRPFAEQSDEDLAKLIALAQGKAYAGEPVPAPLANMAALAQQELQARAEAANQPSVAQVDRVEQGLGGVPLDPAATQARRAALLARGVAPSRIDERLAREAEARQRQAAERLAQAELPGPLLEAMQGGEGPAFGDLMGPRPPARPHSLPETVRYTQGELFGEAEAPRTPPPAEAVTAAAPSPAEPQPPPAPPAAPAPEVAQTRALAQKLYGKATQFNKTVEARDIPELADIVGQKLAAGDQSDEMRWWGNHLGFDEQGQPRNLDQELSIAQAGLVRAGQLAPVQGTGPVQQAEARVDAVRRALVVQGAVGQLRATRAAEAAAAQAQTATAAPTVAPTEATNAVPVGSAAPVDVRAPAENGGALAAGNPAGAAAAAPVEAGTGTAVATAAPSDGPRSGFSETGTGSPEAAPTGEVAPAATTAPTAAPAPAPAPAPAVESPPEPANTIVSGQRMVQTIGPANWDHRLAATRQDLDSLIHDAVKQHGAVKVTMPDGQVGYINGRWKREWADAAGRQWRTVDMLPEDPEAAVRFRIEPATKAEALAAVKGDGHPQASLRDASGNPEPPVALEEVEGEHLGTVQSKPGVNATRLSDLLGPQLYGDLRQLGNVSVKEMFQNSFDAIKGLLQAGHIERGKIDVDVDRTERRITVTDNGGGMTPDILNNAFLTLAGTHKETDRSSGGFGIAKMAFLHGNETLKVVTVRDGVESTLEATGPQLRAAMNDPTQAPPIVLRRTSAPNGTTVSVTLPQTFRDASTGEERDIPMPSSWGLPDSIAHSPLFENIDVTYRGTTAPIGTGFPADRFTHFADVKFPWGNARIIVSKDENKDHYDNVKVLSNGLFQFNTKIGKKPGQSYGDAIPRLFYINVEPHVRPEEAGYPFELSRQGFSKTAKEDFDKIFHYLWLAHSGSDAAETAKGFGQIEYLDRSGGVSGRVALVPPPAEGPQLAINAGDQVEVRDGRLIVNGREVPVLSLEDLKKAKVDLKSFQIDQSQIDPNTPFVHANMMVPRGAENEAYGRPDDGNPGHDSPNRARDPELIPITDAGRLKFGPRFDRFLYRAGEVFLAVRAAVVQLDPSRYDGLEQYGVGLSFDKEYHGVHVKVPFRGIMVNPGQLKGKGATRQALGLYHTMVHEIAHFTSMEHGASFWAEDDNLRSELEVQGKAAEFKVKLQDLFHRYADILNWLREKTNDSATQPGQTKLIEDSYESAREEAGTDGEVGAGPAAGREDQGRDARAAGAAPGPVPRGRAEGPAGTGGEGTRPAGQGANPAGLRAGDGPVRDVGRGLGFGGGRVPPGGSPPASAAAPTSPPEMNRALPGLLARAERGFGQMLRARNLRGHALDLELAAGTLVHIRQRFNHLFRQSEGLHRLAEALRDRSTVHERLSRFWRNANAAWDQLRTLDPKAADKVNQLTQATEFGLAPGKSWAEHTWLHDQPNAAALQRRLAELNDHVHSLKRKGQFQVYENLVRTNEALQYASMAQSLHNLLVSEPGMSAAQLASFGPDPMQAFVHQSSRNETPQAARAYWLRALEQKVAAANALLDSGHDSPALLDRLAGIKSSRDQLAKYPYFHLGRGGDYFVEFRMRSLPGGSAVDPAAQRQVAEALQRAGFTDYQFSPESDRTKAFMRLENEAQMQNLYQLARKLQAQGLLSPDAPVLRGRNLDPKLPGYIRPEWITELLRRASEHRYDTTGMSEEAVRAARAAEYTYLQNLRTAYLDMLPDTALARVLEHRFGVQGYRADMQRNMAFRMNVGITALANMATATRVNGAFQGMHEELRAATGDRSKDPVLMSRVLDEVIRREAERPLRPERGFLAQLRAYNHAYFLGFSPAYVAMQFTQLGALLWPELAKQKGGYVKAAKAIAQVTPAALKVAKAMLQEGVALGWRNLPDAVITEAALRRAGLSEADTDFILRAVNRANIDVGGSSRELGRVAEGRLMGPSETLLRYAGAAGYYAETTTRLIAALAAREMYSGADKEKGLDDYVDLVVEQSMLNYQNWNRGRLFSGPVAKLATAFMSYQFQVLEKLYRELGAAFLGMARNPEEKAEARRFLAAHMAAMTVLSGTLGLPFAAVAARAFEGLKDLFDDDDQPADVVAAWRNFLADLFGKEVGEIVARGAFRGLGIEISRRIGEQDLLPFSQVLTDRRKWEDRIKDLPNEAAGAPWSAAMNLILGGKDMLSGKPLDGMERFMPTAIRSGIQAYRMGTEGYTDRKTGQVLPMTPGAGAILARALGFQPSVQAEYGEASLHQKARRGDLLEAAGGLRQRLAVALERGDRAKVADLLPQAERFDRHNPAYAVLPTLGQVLSGRAEARGRGQALGLPVGTNIRDPGARALTGYANY